ncbi:hypothetical protein PUN28_000910 [Cardiocondyla obscurior]|uniref:Uncharacterized protein n=1 Tax=Cardiocondyla obscurior TaxID=286306 RepID=A0AAW2H1P6_9HYME
MAKTLCLVVAFLLIFAITEASREQTNQTDGQRPHGRGATRYNSRSTTESSDLPTLETRQPRIKNSRSEVSTLEKHEAHPAGEDSIRTRSKPKQTADSFVTTSRTVSRNSNSNNGNGENSRRRQKSFSTQPPKEERARDAHEIKERKFEPPKRPTASRRSSSDASPVWVDNAKLNHDTATRPPEFLRSRTGRKIYATNGRESKSDASPSEGPPENRSAEKAESLSNEPAKEEIQSGHAKIETATEKELKKVDVKSANNSSSVGDEAKDILLSGSESVRVDVPLTVGNSEDVNFLSAVPSRQASRSAKEKPESNDISRSSAKKGRNSDRSKSRNRSKTRDPNSETSITSRRGTSKASRTEETGRSSGSRHRSNAKSATSRGRTAQKSKDAVPAEARSGRQKNADADFETSANRRTEARRDDRRTSEGKRKSKESRSKTTEAKVDGQQDARAQSRSRSRTPTSNLEITTAYIPKATVTEATTVPFANVETTTFNPTTIRPSTTPRTSSSTERVSRNKGRDRGESSRGKKPPKEDFFNHGLGFRGRKTSTEASASLVADSRTTTARSETQLRGNPGWTLKRRPGHINDATSATTASVPVDRDQTNEIVQTNDARSTEAPLNNTKSGRRGTKRPKAKDESNTISSAKGTTRGSKSFNKSEGFGLPKGTDVESDNYPPAFRARLSQLKNSNLKPTGGKSTTRTSVQERPEEHTFKRHTRSSTKTMHASEYTVENESTTDVILHVSPLTNPLTTSTPDPDTRQATKPSLASLFSERSKMKLELARRLIKPELNVDENDFDVTTDGYSESKSRAKEVSTVSESRNVEKTTKATSKLIGARTTHRNSTTVSLTKEKPTVKGRWKLLETRKLPKDRNAEAPLRPFIATTKKSRVTSERAIEETSARSVTEFAVPRLITVSHRDGILGEKATDATRVRFPTTAASREETSTLPNTVKPLEENSIPTTIEPQKLDKYIETITVASIADAAAEPKVRPTEFFQEVTLPPTVTTPGSTFQLSTLSPTRADKVYPVYVPDGKEFNSLDDGERTTIPSEGRSSVRPRYTKPQQPPEVAVSMVTSVTVGPTSRYIRKKTGVFTPYDAVPKASSTEATPAQTKRRDFRPRTSTYRRHSEVSTAGVTITPKPVKYSAQVTPGVPSPSEPFVNVQVANDTTSPTSGVVESSNGSSGNTNVFNPTRSTYFKANTTNLLEQLRSTVAPLLNNLGEKTPIFSGAYSNVNTANSPARITPNGSPPRFSARYKGAELLVRKPSVGQSVVPSITTSSTTASTPIENSGSAPPVAVSSPGEPRFVTYYQALESASIRNENLGVEDASQRQRLTGAVTKVDSNATVPNGADNDTSNNNDTVASIITTTSSPDIITTDTTTAVSPADGLPTSRLGAESNTQEAVTQTPANPDANGGETTSVPTSESPGTTFINVITNTPPTDTSTAAIASSLITTEISATVTSTSQFSTVPDFDDARFAGSTDASTETTEVPLLSSGLQTASDTPDTIAPITESVTVTRVLETTTVPINDTENFEANGVQELEETTLRATEAAYINEDIETNTVQQFDATTPYSTTESTTTIESTTTEEISNDIIEARATAAPAFSSTYRTRLIDYAQDILSRLSQKDFSTFRTPIQRPTVTTTIFPDFANAIPDSSSTNTEDFAPEEASTARGPESGTDGTTESLDFDVELVSTNGLKAATQNSISLETSSQIQFNDQETTQNVEAATVTSIPRVTDFVTQNDAQSSNDTLLTELMTIAKTLFTEAMNDTRQSIDGTVGSNNKNQIVSVNGASEATVTTSEFSEFLEREKPNVSLAESNAQPTDINSVEVTTTSSQIETEASDTVVTGSTSLRLTTNTPHLQLSNPIKLFNNNTEQQIAATVVNNTQSDLSNRLSEFATDLVTDESITTPTNTERMLPSLNESSNKELITSVATTEINVRTTVVDNTNQTPEFTTTIPATGPQADQFLVTNTSDIVTVPSTIFDTSDTQPTFGTEPSTTTESIRSLASFTDTNQFSDVTTNAPQTLTDLVSETPNLITRLQDTTSTTTAQGTAGTRLFRPEQTTQTITTTAPNVMSSTTLSVTNFTTLPASSTSATSTPSAPSSSIESTTIPSLRTTPTETSSRPQFTTSVGSTSETTTVTADINENLVSTETTTDASTARVTTTTATETDDLNTISRMNDGETTTTTTTTTSAAPSTNTTTTARTTVLNRVPPSPSSMPSGSPNTPPYLNRFGGGQVTPRPGSSKAPVRDYLIYGIYPNKTIVRKRPEDNLIDGRNVDSPYVIFGIFPDGRLVRKFPNGTIIPDSPRNPVEVVFTLRTTTTTNRPAPWPYYNQANQAGSYNNQYQAPVFNYGRPVDELAGGAKSPGPLDFGVIGNAIGVTPGGPNFAGPLGPPASVPNANKMSDILLNSQMGAIPNAAFGNQQTSSTGQAQGPAGSSIFQDRERNEASRTRVTSDQRNSVYIGQIDGAPNVNPKVVDVRINSVASSVNEGPASSPAVPSFEGLLNNQSGGGVITAPPGFPWRDPLDQIFGITTNSPIQTASVASNQLDEPTESNASVTSRPLSPLVELFTPAVSSTTAASTTAGVTSTTTASTTTPTSTTTVSTTPTTTTTLAPTTSATTTTTSASTTTTITTTATPRTSTTTLTPSTTASATFTTGTLITIPQLAQAASFINTYAVPYTTTGVGTVPPSSTASTISANNILNRLQTNAAENPFGTTYGDLAFLNSLLQNDVKSTTPKTLSEVEQMLANRILSLALANPGPTRSPKAIQAVSLNTNAIQNRPSGSAPGPIIIDLLPVSSPPSVTSSSTSKRYTEAIPTTRPNSASTITTRAPVVITAKPKTTARPKATSQEPIGFGMGLWRALFSGNLFQTTTAASTVKKPKPSVKATTSKPVTIAQAPAQIQPTLNHVMSAIKSPTTTRSVDISDIHVASSTSLADSIISASTPSTVSTTLLNNPNPRLTDISSSTFSPDEDAKFLAALLRAIQTESATSTSTTARGLSDDDEAFLRAILSNQASIFTTATPSTEANPAALLAMLLKQQGIEPTTPATSLREQLQLSSSTPNAIPTQSTTQPITTIPINTARQVVTPKPSARPRPRPAPQTTTWAPSSTYPPPLFGGDGSSGSGLATATRAIGRFLGAAISGAAQQLQSLLRNSTRSAAG